MDRRLQQPFPNSEIVVSWKRSASVPEFKSLLNRDFSLFFNEAHVVSSTCRGKNHGRRSHTTQENCSPFHALAFCNSGWTRGADRHHCSDAESGDLELYVRERGVSPLSVAYPHNYDGCHNLHREHHHLQQLAAGEPRDPWRRDCRRAVTRPEREH